MNQYCRKCGDESKFYFRKQCVKTCPSYSYILGDICINCKENNLFFYNNTCLNVCPVGTFSDYSVNFCRNMSTNSFSCLNGGNLLNSQCICAPNFVGDICQYSSLDITNIISSFGIYFV